MPSMRQGVQSELQLDHPLAQTHWLQAVRVRAVRASVPEESGLEAASGDTARRLASAAAYAAAAYGCAWHASP